MKEKDQLYAQPRDTVSGFVFDQSVVDVFPDMIQRSVPGYQTIIHMIGEIAARFAQNNSTLYDLGCSLGACTLSMAERIQTQDVSIVAVDNSPSMIAECQRRLLEQKPPVPVELLCEDIAQVVIQDASICILNFTLQFIPISQRRELMEKIAKGLKPGGVLILSEKLAFHDDDHERLMIDLHHHFKRSNGYSDLEIAQKRSSLENVLIPETLDAHKKRLYQAGFRAVECWFQCFNFASIVAFK